MKFCVTIVVGGAFWSLQGSHRLIDVVVKKRSRSCLCDASLGEVTGVEIENL